MVETFRAKNTEFRCTLKGWREVRVALQNRGAGVAMDLDPKGSRADTSPQFNGNCHFSPETP